MPIVYSERDFKKEHLLSVSCKVAGRLGEILFVILRNINNPTFSLFIFDIFICNVKNFVVSRITCSVSYFAIF